MEESGIPPRRRAAAAPSPTSSSYAMLVAGALGIWLGLYAFRFFMAMVVWNVGEDRPPEQMGLIALGVFAVGLLGWLPARFCGGARPAWRFGVLLAALTLARQGLPGELLSPALAFAAAIAWLWWLPAFIQELAGRSALAVATPAVLLGLSAQVAAQTALHGLELTAWAGPWAILAAAVLAGAFLAAMWRGGAASIAQPNALADASWGAFALGPFLFLQMTLLASLGQVQMLGNWTLAPAAALVQLSLLAGLALVAWTPARPVRIALAALAVAWLAPGDRLIAGNSVWTLLPLQIALTAALASAFTPAPSRSRGRTSGFFAGGALLLFAFLFLYYSEYGWPTLWPIAAALTVLPALRRDHAVPAVSTRPAVAALAIAALGLAIGALPAPGGRPAAGPAPGELKVLDYNIHQGLDYFSVPAVSAMASVIAAADADLVALQEVPRGAVISGSSDLVSWLRWRFPQYHLVVGPVISDMWTNVIMSKYPLVNTGQLVYTKGNSATPRGLVWAEVPLGQGTLLFINSHLTAYAGAGNDQDRRSQAAELLRFWNGRRPTLVAGDFNAQPSDPAIRQIVAAGLEDLPATQGLGEAFTYASGRPYERIDYIFATADIVAIKAAIPATTASDHSPVTATIRLR